MMDIALQQQMGEVLAMCKETQRQTIALFTKFDSMNEEVIEQRGQIKLLNLQLTEHKVEDKEVHKVVTETEKTVDEVRNKGKGLLVGLTLLGGGGGLAGVLAGFKVFFLGHSG